MKTEQLEIIEELSEKQFRAIYGVAHGKHYPVRAVIGAKFSSKTFQGMRFADYMIQKYPGYIGLITFSTLRQARNVYYEKPEGIEETFKKFGLNPRFNEQKMEFKVAGVTVHLRSYERDVIRTIESLQYAWCWADEISDASRYALQTIHSRIRAVNGFGEALYTGMPDDPTHHMYEWLEGIGADLQELSIWDNPDRAAAETYADSLRKNYRGAELERYLEGKRVSLSVSGRVLASFGEHNKIPCGYHAGYPLYFMLDFNKRPMTGTLWQVLPKSAVSSAIDTTHVRYADTLICQIDESVAFPTGREVFYEDAGVWLATNYPNHGGEIYLGGDVVGKYSQQGTGVVPYDEVKKKLFIAFPASSIYDYLSDSAPSIQMSADKANRLLLSSENLVTMVINPECVFSMQSYAGSRWKVGASGNQIDKSIDGKASFEVAEDGRTVSSSPTTHPQDTLRYFAEKISDDLLYLAAEQSGTKRTKATGNYVAKRQR